MERRPVRHVPLVGEVAAGTDVLAHENVEEVMPVPADLTGEHHKSGDTVQDLYRSIALGLDGTPMVGYLEALGSDKVWALAAYVKSLSTPSDAAE